MKKKKESLLLGKLLTENRSRALERSFLGTRMEYRRMITFKNGNNSFFRYNTVDLNPIGASDTARDKDYSNLFMERTGLPYCPRQQDVFFRTMGQGDRFA